MEMFFSEEILYGHRMQCGIKNREMQYNQRLTFISSVCFRFGTELAIIRLEQLCLIIHKLV